MLNDHSLRTSLRCQRTQRGDGVGLQVLELTISELLSQLPEQYREIIIIESPAMTRRDFE